MNNRGFTLIELLGVIIILSVIIAIVLPTVNSVVNKSKITVENVQIEKILNGAYDYSIKKTSLLPDEGNKTYITLNELKKYGYIDSNITDPNTNKIYSNDMFVSIEYIKDTTIDKIDNSMIEGNYLYKLNIKNNKCDPVINISDKQNIVTINIGDDYIEPQYSALDCNDKDITNKVIKNITKDGANVKTIDSQKNGIYYIDYCVVDNDGNVICESISIVVKDDEVPILTIPSNETISISDTEYNLMNGVVCSDNSKKCEIDIEGSIEFGVAGKNIIKYIAVDPSGNTTTKKRVITIN